MKKRILAAVLGMAAGVAILFIPFLMDRRQAYQNALAISAMISRYDRYDENRSILDEQLSQASVYNKWLAGEAEKDGIRAYEEQLSFDGNGVMGYLWIPSIDLKILLYHGTTDETLAAGAGHLEHTSLPVGGISSHCVVTAHSGMRASRAFDDIRLLRKGDLFAACVYGNQYVYEVERTEVVLPEETTSLQIVKGEDRMTLVTCTPYGINDHRLLVHGLRSERKMPESIEDKEGGTGNPRPPSFRVDLRSIPLFCSGLIVLIVLTYIVINLRKKRRKKNRCHMKKS